MVLTEWLVGKFGEIVFSDCPPDQDREDLGINALREALHYARWRSLPPRAAALAERMYQTFCAPLPDEDDPADEEPPP